ncbi:putative tRNA/rRNA methyltransferase YsgA, partial [Tetrabaena socialis]
ESGLLRARLLLLVEGAPLPRCVSAAAVVRCSEAVMRKASGVESAGGVQALAELDLPPEDSLAGLIARVGGRTAEQAGETGAAKGGVAEEEEAGGRGREAAQEDGAAAGAEDRSRSSSGASPSAPPPPPGGSHRAPRHSSGTLPHGTTTDTRTAPPPPPTTAVRLLVLDAVQDPGNLGTLVRSALAFGWHGLCLLPGCCDPFNDKAVRASRGAVLRLPIAYGSLDELAAAAGG